MGWKATGLDSRASTLFEFKSTLKRGVNYKENEPLVLVIDRKVFCDGVLGLDRRCDGGGETIKQVVDAR